MSHIEITNHDDGHRFSAYRSDPAPDTGRSPAGVVVVQEIFGVNQHIRDVVDRFGEAGFVAVAPALFDRIETGAELGYDEAGMKKGIELAWNGLSLEQAVSDIGTTADALAEELGGPTHVGVVGFCYGGMLTAAAAARLHTRIGAAVAYYPSMAAETLVDDRVEAPLLIHLGDLDQRVTVEHGRELAERWPSAEIYRYADAGHGFNCDLRPGYHADSAAVAWERTLTFFDQNLDTRAP
ncbi:MAG: dienelactone hydrolase family protein [Acidimicrobiales bacterium]|nr:dienelactone hydrolase family protein [Acidimicrobiales bacterium]